MRKVTSYKGIVFAQSDFLRPVGSLNESFRLITIYYTFKYSVGIKRTLLDSLRSQKSPLNSIFGKASYNDFLLARSDFLGLVGALNESLRLIIIY